MIYPSGPPQLWQMNARNAAVNTLAGMQDSLNQDPQYAQEYLRTGTPPTVDTSQSSGFRPLSPHNPIGYSFSPLSLPTQALIQQRQTFTNQQDDYQQRLVRILQGLQHWTK